MKIYLFFFFNYFNNTNNYYNYTITTYLDYTFSFIFNLVKIEYKFRFYDTFNNLIFPPDLKLYKNISIICHIEIKNINIESLASIYNNNYYQCTEFFNIYEKVIIGIKIYISNEKEDNIDNYIYYKFQDVNINFDNLKYKNDDIFNPLIINNKHISMVQKMYDKKINKTLKLKNSYYQYPYCTLKRNAIINENIWIFANIYNYFFCFCLGQNCFNTKIPQKCKYYFYLNIIDNNRDVYEKTDYLFIDFIFEELSSDDVFPIFKEMEKRRLPVHYVSGKLELYKEYCNKKNKCLTIIPVNRDNYYMSGDFLEKYLTLFLKLKAVISGKYTNLHIISNLFYNIEYIVYIAIGHGVCFFKDYLFSEYRIYGNKKNDKILIPPSEKLINIAKKYGWTDNDIIKINLPRWDKFNNNDKKLLSLSRNETIIKNNSIFIMFTWRDIKKNKEISSFYIKNIVNILNNNRLYKELEKKNITLYFTVHRNIKNKYYNNYMRVIRKYKLIENIEQNLISECLSKTSLVLTDFSSIIFDIMYRKKPYILFIPDLNDPIIKDIYTSDYYNIIESFKNGTIIFENIFLNINETINKIIYYINNNFNIELNLEKFYTSFNFKVGNNINKFINYLLNLK